MIRTSIPVLCYHNVSEIDGHTPALFAEHLDAISDAGYRTISGRELLSVVRGQMKAPRKSVVLTFDDGHLSNWLTVTPELAKRNMTGTFFALTDFTVDGAVRTLDDAPEMKTMPAAFKEALQDGDYNQFINVSEYKAMMNAGMEIFSHGCRHQGIFRTLQQESVMGNPNARWPAWSIYPGVSPDWPVFKDASGYVYDGFKPVLDGLGMPKMVARTTEERLEFCRKDFARSYDVIREINGYDEQLFCWPWGQFCEDAEVELKKAGYVSAFTLERWVNAKGTNPYRLNRLGVGRPKTGKWVQQRLRMYNSDPTARVFFKLHRKRPEIKRVLYTTDSVRFSGGSRQMANNIKAMAAMGMKTYAMLQPDSPIAEALSDTNVTIIPFTDFRSYMKAGSFLKKVVVDNKIDVVHTFHNRAYKAGVIAKLMGAKCKLFINRGVISRPNDIFFLWTALSNGVICNSGMCAEVLRKHKVKPKLLNVVYNAYSGPDFGEPKPRKKRGTRFVYMGNGAEIKGLDVFLNAASRFCDTANPRDTEFAVIGLRTDDAKLFEQYVSPALKERLTYVGEIPHAEVLEELQFSDVLCMTSRLESLPNTILEGFDLGLPALCTAVGGVPELVKDGLNGCVCQSEDVACLAEKMQLLASDPAKRFNMARVGRAVVRTLLTPEAKGRNLMRVYMGEQLNEPLAVEDLAAEMELDENPYESCEH